MVQVVCTVATQDDMICGSSPQLVTPAAKVTFTVTTYTTGGPAYAGKMRLWPPAAGGLALAGLIVFLVPGRGRTLRRWMAPMILLAASAVSGMGCNSSMAAANAGTPLGVATLKVTAMDYVDNVVPSQTLYFTVNVTAQ